MKRCPECRRDYYDDTLLYCLDDGTALLEGPASGSGAGDEPATTILPGVVSASEPSTRVYEAVDVVRTEPEKSIAVLPFVNLSQDPDNEYFSDGLAEEIINVLSQIPELKVTARTSCFAFRGKEQDIRKIAEALGVGTILEGSVRRIGDRIRVTIQLINARDGYQLWSERFDREVMDVFAVQDEIAAAIAAALQVTLSGTQTLVQNYEPSLPAYEAFLKGRHQYYKFSPEASTRAEEYFRQAEELDPKWAEPRSALGELYFSLGFYGWRPLDEMIPLARGAARTALELNANQPLAHAVLGAVSALHDYDWKDAEEHFEQARTAESLHPNVQLLYAMNYLLPLGRLKEAVNELAKTIAQDPLNGMWHARTAWTFLFGGIYEKAIMEAQKALEIDDRDYQAQMVVALSYGFQGKLTEARKASDEAFRLGPFDSLNRGFRAGLLEQTGEKDLSEKLIAEMTGAIPVGMMMYHLFCSRIDEAIEWYQKDLEERRPNAPMLAYASFTKPLREHPRWPQIAKMMNLAESL